MFVCYHLLGDFTFCASEAYKIGSYNFWALPLTIPMHTMPCSHLLVMQAFLLTVIFPFPQNLASFSYLSILDSEYLQRTLFLQHLFSFFILKVLDSAHITQAGIKAIYTFTESRGIRKTNMAHTIWERSTQRIVTNGYRSIDTIIIDKTIIKTMTASSYCESNW